MAGFTTEMWNVDLGRREVGWRRRSWGLAFMVAVSEIDIETGQSSIGLYENVECTGMQQLTLSAHNKRFSHDVAMLKKGTCQEKRPKPRLLIVGYKPYKFLLHRK